MTLRSKLVVTIAALVLALGLAGTLHARLTLSGISQDQLERRGHAIASDLASHAANLIVANDIYGVYERLNSLLLSNEDVRYIVVFGPDGEVLASTFEAGIPSGLLTANSVSGAERYRVQRLDTNEGPVLDVAVPILQGRAGVVRVGVSEQSIRSQVDRLTITLLGLTAAVLVLGTAAAYVLALLLTRPLSKLADAALAFGRGDLSRRVPTGRDEVGQVGAAFNSMAEDLDRSRQKLEAAHQELLRHNAELAMLNAVALAVGRSLDAHEVLASALDQVLERMDLPGGCVLLPGEGDEFRVAVSRGETVIWPSEPVRCACLDALRTSQSAVATRSPRCPCYRAAAGKDALFLRLASPLVAHGQVLGVLCVAAPGREHQIDDARRLLSSVGHYVGVALENARLYEEVRQRDETHSHLLAKAISAQEEERKRIARELHDESAQALTSLLMRLDAAMAAGGLSPATRERLEQIRSQAVRTLEETRRLIKDLRPTALDDLGLVAAIRAHAEDALGAQGVDVRVSVEGLSERLPSEVETTLFRIVQEATNNCLRHARARSFRVTLSRRNGRIVGEVTDDGVGFDMEAVFKHGTNLPLGLLGMQERAALVGGDLAIWSRPGEGTRIHLELPLPGSAS